MKIKKFINFSVLLIFILTSTAMAAIPQISNNKYIRMYGLSTQNNLPVFTNQQLNQRGTSNPARAYQATIYANDEIYVYQMTNAWALISYPVKNGRAMGYVRTSDLTSNNYSQSPKNSQAQINNIFARPGVRYPSSSISRGDSVWTVARQGNYTQVVYPAGNLYKMAWITNDDYNRYISGGGSNLKGDLNNDGKVDNADLNLMRDYMIEKIGDSAINKNNADINSDGEVDIVDYTMLLDSVNKPQPVTPSKDFPSSIYLTQVGKSTCTLVASAMMLRAKAYLNGNGTWNSITENSLRSTAWIEHQGLRHEFTYKNMRVSHVSVSGISPSSLKNLLDRHPEGVVIHCNSLPHAVWVISYSGDTFYCSDPLSNYSGDKRPLANSYLGRRLGSQSSILNRVTAYWYIP